MPKIKTYFNWSSGKDSALGLYYLLQDGNYDVGRLLTSMNTYHDRVSMHGLRRSLLEAQLQALGIPCTTLELPEEPSMSEYEILMRKKVTALHDDGFTCAAFGDIFLGDLRTYREQQLAAFDMQAVFPLWQRDTRQLLTEFIGLGFKAVLTCVNSGLLNRSFAGRIIDKQFISDLPEGVDACGERGEFHTFCFDGPIFSHPVPFTIGDKVYREYKSPETEQQNMGFWFCDLLPIHFPQI